MRRTWFALTVVPLAALFALAPPPAAAGPITPAAFGPGAVVTNFDGLGLAFRIDSPQVIGGNTYSVADGFRYSDFGVNRTQQLGTNIDTRTMTVTLAQDALRAGGYVGTAGPASEEVRFYDAGHNLLGTVLVVNLGADLEFAGWETTGAAIHSVEFQDTATNGLVMLLDNFTTEVAPEVAAPEPTSLMLFGLGLAGLAAMRRRTGR